MTTPVTADQNAISRAADVLRRGGLVAFPTETVYGLGADATNANAVADIYATKDRPDFNPLIVHLESTRAVEQIFPLNGKAKTLAAAFWPGPLTLVLRRPADCPVSLLVSAGMDTVAVRVPDHPVALTLLGECGLPIAAPSANRSGRISPTCAAHVAEDIGDKPVMILDGGSCRIGVESTIIDATGDANGEHLTLLRPGGIPIEDIEQLVGPVERPQNDTGKISSPGQLPSHYAPAHPMRLNAEQVREGESLISFGRQIEGTPLFVRNLSETGNLNEAAANLFAALRELDATQCTTIAVMPIPEQGLGIAINDRLRRAAAPKNSGTIAQ